MPDAPGVKKSLTAIGRALAAQERAEAQLWQAVADAREAGASWSAIGDALGVTKQTAFERFTRQY